jgi:hypothetical protein
MGRTLGLPVRGGQVLGPVGVAGQETEMSGGNNTRQPRNQEKTKHAAHGPKPCGHCMWGRSIFPEPLLFVSKRRQASSPVLGLLFANWWYVALCALFGWLCLLCFLCCCDCCACSVAPPTLLAFRCQGLQTKKLDLLNVQMTRNKLQP